MKIRACLCLCNPECGCRAQGTGPGCCWQDWSGCKDTMSSLFSPGCYNCLDVWSQEMCLSIPPWLFFQQHKQLSLPTLWPKIQESQKGYYGHVFIFLYVGSWSCRKKPLSLSDYLEELNCKKLSSCSYILYCWIQTRYRFQIFWESTTVQ